METSIKVSGERSLRAEESREEAATAVVSAVGGGPGLYNGTGMPRPKNAFCNAASVAASEGPRGMSYALRVQATGRKPPWSLTPGHADLEALTPPLPLPRIISALGLAEKDALNVWCGGSRLWGCSKATSDYDVYVVHRSKDPALRVATCRLRKPCRMDATLLHADEWSERLRLHNPIWTMLISHPLPWMLRLDPGALGFQLTPQRLSNMMLSHSLREWARVRKCFVDGATPDVASGRETLTHLLRTYELITQLCEHHRVTDFTVGERIRKELSGYASPEWTWWRDEFEPRMEALQLALRTAARREWQPADEVA